MSLCLLIADDGGSRRVRDAPRNLSTKGFATFQGIQKFGTFLSLQHSRLRWRSPHHVARPPPLLQAPLLAGTAAARHSPRAAASAMHAVGLAT